MGYFDKNLEQYMEREWKGLFRNVMRFRKMYRMVEREEHPIESLASYIAMTFTPEKDYEFAISLTRSEKSDTEDKTFYETNLWKVFDYYVRRTLRSNPELTRTALSLIPYIPQIGYTESHPLFVDGRDSIKKFVRVVERRIFN